jgi:hypothetical protein
MDSKKTAQKYFDNMRSITMDSDDARDCAIVMVKEIQRNIPQQWEQDLEFWDDVIKDLKTTTKGLKVKK